MSGVFFSEYLVLKKLSRFYNQREEKCQQGCWKGNVFPLRNLNKLIIYLGNINSPGRRNFWKKCPIFWLIRVKSEWRSECMGLMGLNSMELKAHYVTEERGPSWFVAAELGQLGEELGQLSPVPVLTGYKSGTWASSPHSVDRLFRWLGSGGDGEGAFCFPRKRWRQ